MKKEEMKITELYDLTHTLASDCLLYTSDAADEL